MSLDHASLRAQIDDLRVGAFNNADQHRREQRELSTQYWKGAEAAYAFALTLLDASASAGPQETLERCVVCGDVPVTTVCGRCYGLALAQPGAAEPVTQGDPPPGSPEDFDAHPWKREAPRTPDRNDPACINCHRSFSPDDQHCWWGHHDVGPFCERCYQTVKRHEREAPSPGAAPDVEPAPAVPSPAPKPAFASDYQRMWDLVRVQRGELLDAGLITREEYSALLADETKGKPGQGSPSPRRLESYDELRAELTRLTSELARVQEEWKETGGEQDKLTDYFATENYTAGWQGDQRDESPVECAIRTMREYKTHADAADARCAVLERERDDSQQRFAQSEHDWQEAEHQLNACRSQLAAAEQTISRLREALQAIADHDGERHDEVDGCLETKPSPQVLAVAALRLGDPQEGR